MVTIELSFKDPHVFLLVNCMATEREREEKEKRKRRGLPRCFWIRALSTQQGGYVRATNLIIIIININCNASFCDCEEYISSFYFQV